jgi:hypothetical protein
MEPDNDTSIVDAIRRDIALLFAMQAYDTLEPIEEPECWGGLEIHRDDGQRFVVGRRLISEAAKLASPAAQLAAANSYGWAELWRLVSDNRDVHAPEGSTDA